MDKFKIYKVENKINGDSYIGKTIRDFGVRKKRHLYDAKTNAYISKFHRALMKYGFENFEWSILCTTDNYNKLNKLEIFYIEIYSKIMNLYNISKGGEAWSPIIIKDSTREKLSKAWHNNPRVFCGKENARFGKEVSQETRKKISEANKGKKSWNKGIPCRDETKRKLSEKAKKRPGTWTGKKRVFSVEHKKKISESLKIRIYTEEHRKNLSEAQKRRHAQSRAIAAGKL